jgi:hypothetical protein
MMVARHEVPGNARTRNPSRRVRYDLVYRALFNIVSITALCGPSHTVPYGTDRRVRRSQAVPAWLPSFSPSGTPITHSTRLMLAQGSLSPITSHFSRFTPTPDTRLDSPPGSATLRPDMRNNRRRRTHSAGDCRTNQHRRMEPHYSRRWLVDSN